MDLKLTDTIESLRPERDCTAEKGPPRGSGARAFVDADSRPHVNLPIEHPASAVMLDVESSPHAVAVVGPDGRIIDCSRKYIQLVGLPPAGETTVPGTGDFFAPEAILRIVDDLHGMPGRDAQRDVETTIVGGDGRPRAVEISTIAVRGHGGVPIAFLAIVRDVTERTREHETRRRQAIDLGERIKELDCLIRLSELADRHGDSQKDMLQAAVEIIPSGWQYPDIACARILLEHEEFRTPVFEETLWKQSSGIFAHGSLIGGLEVCYLEERPAADEGPFLKEERDLIDAVATQVGKLIELKRAYDTLRQGEEKYRGLFEANNDAIFIVESDTLRVIDCNRQAERLTGCARDELLSMTAGSILSGRPGSPAPDDVVRRILRSARATECEVITGNGTAIPTSTFTASFEYGGRLCHQLILRDISDQKETEHVLLAAKEAAELAARMKSEFVANVSHELRTPMNAIIGFADMMLDTHLSEEQREFVGIIKTSGESLITLINEILDFSRIESCRMEIESLPFPPALAIQEACDRIRTEAARKGINLVCSIGDEVPRIVRGDPGRFRQVIVNLLENAAKFTEHGSIDISAGAAFGPGEEITLRVSVRDTGIGIPKDKLPIIFAPFQQVDGSNTREHGGTGLGLTICKKIATLLGGDIRVESEPGTGSTFHFTARVGACIEKETS
jgi:PAS domain S-box-containing protein